MINRSSARQQVMKARKPKLGSGARFKSLTKKLKKQDKVISDLDPIDLKEMLKVDFNLKIDLFKSINARKLKGGTAVAQVKKEILTAKKSLKL